MAAPVLFWFGLDDVRKGTLHLASEMVHSEVVCERDDIAFKCFEVPEKYDRLLWWDADDGRWREHVVRETRALASGTCEVVADSVLFETRCDFADAVRFENVGLRDVLKWLVPLTRFAAGSWTYSKGGTESAWLSRMSVYEGIRKLERLYHIEFFVEIEVDEAVQRVSERRLCFCAEQGAWRGLRLVHGKNLPVGYLHVCADEVVTALYGYGMSFGAYDEDGTATGGWTRRLTFRSVNGGLDYVGDEQARERYGRKSADGSRRHNFGYKIFEDEDSASDLYMKTHRALQELTSPRVEYAVEDAIDLSGVHVGLGDTALVVASIGGAPWRQGLRVTGRVRRFGRKRMRQSVRLGKITAETYSSFSAYERQCGSVASFDDALVAAGLRKAEDTGAAEALSVDVELRSALRGDGSEIDLRYAFELLSDDEFQFDVLVTNRLASPVYDVSVAAARGGIVEKLVFLAAGGSKLYSVEVSPTAGEVAFGRLVFAAEASCPERFVGTSQHYEACSVTDAVELPLSDVPKPVDSIPSDLNGDGTFANPYTVADLRRCVCVSTSEPAIDAVWVSGYVVGWADMGASSIFGAGSLRLGAEGAVASNVVLAGSPDETDATRMVAVNLSTATRRRKAVRAALNLADNPQMVGRRVWVLGDIMRYGGATGVRHTDEYRYEVDGRWYGWWTINGQLGEELRG